MLNNNNQTKITELLNYTSNLRGNISSFKLINFPLCLYSTNSEINLPQLFLEVVDNINQFNDQSQVNYGILSVYKSHFDFNIVVPEEYKFSCGEECLSNYYQFRNFSESIVSRFNSTRIINFQTEIHFSNKKVSLAKFLQELFKHFQEIKEIKSSLESMVNSNASFLKNKINSHEIESKACPQFYRYSREKCADNIKYYELDNAEGFCCEMIFKEPDYVLGETSPSSDSGESPL